MQSPYWQGAIATLGKYAKHRRDAEEGALAEENPSSASSLRSTPERSFVALADFQRKETIRQQTAVIEHALALTTIELRECGKVHCVHPTLGLSNSFFPQLNGSKIVMFRERLFCLTQFTGGCQGGGDDDDSRGTAAATAVTVDNDEERYEEKDDDGGDESDGGGRSGTATCSGDARRLSYGVTKSRFSATRLSNLNWSVIDLKDSGDAVTYSTEEMVSKLGVDWLIIGTSKDKESTKAEERRRQKALHEEVELRKKQALAKAVAIVKDRREALRLKYGLSEEGFNELQREFESPESVTVDGFCIATIPDASDLKQIAMRACVREALQKPFDDANKAAAEQNKEKKEKAEEKKECVRSEVHQR